MSTPSVASEATRARHAGRGAFVTTQWSVVLAAAGEGSTAGAAALETLCRRYWYPVYAWIRRRGCGADEAQDLAQGFFARLLEREALTSFEAPRGRFRWFLLAALRHFLADERDRARALKRGGGRLPVSLDEQDAEGRYLREPADTESPDRLFERRWAWTVLEEGLERLREEFALAGRAGWFERLQACVAGEDREECYAVIARDLGATEGAVKMAVQRARRRLREILRSVVSSTVADERDGEAELRELAEALRR